MEEEEEEEEVRRPCQRDLFSALTGHLFFFPGGQMNFLLLEAQFQ